jgi:hypothetical protein
MSESNHSPIVGQALADLAARLSVEVASIQVLSVEDIEWRDSSLGVPQAGQMYAQVITPGYRITLQMGGKRYRYHADERRVIFAGGD